MVRLGECQGCTKGMPSVVLPETDPSLDLAARAGYGNRNPWHSMIEVMPGLHCIRKTNVVHFPSVEFCLILANEDLRDATFTVRAAAGDKAAEEFVNEIAQRWHDEGYAEKRLGELQQAMTSEIGSSFEAIVQKWIRGR